VSRDKKSGTEESIEINENTKRNIIVGKERKIMNTNNKKFLFIHATEIVVICKIEIKVNIVFPVILYQLNIASFLLV
jgi:hypothetical protein